LKYIIVKIEGQKLDKSEFDFYIPTITSSSSAR